MVPQNCSLDGSYSAFLLVGCGGFMNNFFTEREIAKLKEYCQISPYTCALIIISRVYKNKQDRAGNPEYWHFIRVSSQFTDETEQTTALLHDIVEDGYITFDDLYNIGISEEIIDALILLNHDKSVFEKYEDYISNILDSNNYLAIKVKYADMLDNMNRSREIHENLDFHIKQKLHRKYEQEFPRILNKLEESGIDLNKERKLVC